MANTILNEKKLTFLEEIIVQYGTVVSYQQIASHIPYEDDVARRRFVSQLTQAGWLVRIKKGLYQVAADVASLGTLTLSRYAIAQHLLPGSYVSFEAALQFHGLHDQLMQTTTSIGLKQHKMVTLQGYTYRFVKTSEQYFFGFDEHTFDGQPARIARVEKALIDMVQFHRSAHTTDRVLEILFENQEDVDLKRATGYLLRSNLTTQRIFGLFFDRLSLPYDRVLEKSARDSSAASSVDDGSEEYSAKWRLYYNPEMFAHYVSEHST